MMLARCGGASGVVLVSRMIVAVLWFVALSNATFACTFARGAFLKTLDSWSTTCGHPLCGKIFAGDPEHVKKNPPPCDADVWLTLKDDLTAAVAQGGVILVGEEHDNPKHHELRALLGLGNYAAIVFEQIAADQAPALSDVMGQLKGKINEGSLETFKSAIGWNTSGWAKYNYDPLLRGALFSMRPIYAGDVAHSGIMKVAKEGEAAVPVEERARLKLDVPLSDKLAAQSVAEIEQAHCGAMPKEALGGMAYAQRYRDASLADVALKAVEKHGSAILFSGNGHVRSDRGVPWYIRARAAEKKVVSIILAEVEDGKTDAESYVPRDPDGKPAADYIIFTPRSQRGDPCEAMKKKAD